MNLTSFLEHLIIAPKYFRNFQSFVPAAPKKMFGNRFNYPFREVHYHEVQKTH